MESSRYPSDGNIKVEWNKWHSIIIGLVTILSVVLLILERQKDNVLMTKYCSVIGLWIDFLGVVIASLKTPSYGTFYDGGELNRKCKQVEDNAFKKGMFIIAFGLIFQMIGSIFQ
jgi:hypothetical protein